MSSSSHLHHSDHWGWGVRVPAEDTGIVSPTARLWRSHGHSIPYSWTYRQLKPPDVGAGNRPHILIRWLSHLFSPTYYFLEILYTNTFFIMSPTLSPPILATLPRHVLHSQFFCFPPHPLHNSPLSAWRKACLLKILIALSALVSFQLLSWCSGISCASVVGGFPGSPVWLYSVPLVSFQVFILKSLQIWSKSGRKHSPRRSYLLSSIFPSQMPHFVI